MTYCVAIKVNEGIVCLGDTRTNAGLDNISMFRKLNTFENAGERVIAMMSSGNLAITQSVVSMLEENLEAQPKNIETIFTAPTIFRVAEVVGSAMRIVQDRDGPALVRRGEASDAMIIVAGQRAGGDLRLFLVYSAGNFIEATDDTPFFQIGEHKYGKPILDRVITPETTLEETQRAALLSMDSTLRSNLSVGMPLDMAVIRKDTFGFERVVRIEAEDERFRAMSAGWSQALRDAFTTMEGFPL